MPGYRDYQVIIDGTVVAQGPGEFIAEILGMRRKALTRWIHDEKHRRSGAINALPTCWVIDGKILSNEEAQEELGVTQSKLYHMSYEGKIQRYRVEKWSLPPEDIQKLAAQFSSWHCGKVSK